MAAVGLALLRKLAPSSNFGYIISTFAEKSFLGQRLHLHSPLGLHTSKTIRLRALLSGSPLQSPAGLPGKGGASGKAIDDRKLKAGNNAMGQKPSDFKSRRGPLDPPQISAAPAPRSRKSRSATMREEEDNAAERKSSTVKLAGELTEVVDKPSAYVTSDFVDHRAMQLVFLGTSSSIPTWNRSTSSTALRLDGSIFLFDCGEGAVRQILKTPMKHYDIDNIFITHMHGDHVSNCSALEI